MFVLNPGGSKGSGLGGPQGTLRQHLWFVGQFGIYFGLLRAAFAFMSSGADGPKKIEN